MYVGRVGMWAWELGEFVGGGGLVLAIVLVRVFYRHACAWCGPIPSVQHRQHELLSYTAA